MNKRRPIDKVYHSIIVAIEVIESRRLFLGELDSPKVHPETEKMIQQTIESLNSLFSLENFEKIFTPRGQELMKISAEKINEIKRELAA